MVERKRGEERICNEEEERIRREKEVRKGKEKTKFSSGENKMNFNLRKKERRTRP